MDTLLFSQQATGAWELSEEISKIFGSTLENLKKSAPEQVKIFVFFFFRGISEVH